MQKLESETLTFMNILRQQRRVMTLSLHFQVTECSKSYNFLSMENGILTFSASLSFSRVPILNLHSPMIVELLVHFKSLPEHMRLVAPALL